MDLGEKVNEFINKWKDKPKYFLYSSEVSALLKKVVLDTKYENDLMESQERWSVCDQDGLKSSHKETTEDSTTQMITEVKVGVKKSSTEPVQNVEQSKTKKGKEIEVGEKNNPQNLNKIMLSNPRQKREKRLRLVKKIIHRTCTK
ncbi:hypothetical protein ZOSMA_124G00010 [Zostera marina]|uniref:Uncharacterized protein n=1 Tax=Zostera marina TaxID=29655 RepID=A0A0K9Q2G1_ZOSMR|nr:hypothetical protein ZOSMA_124G00010 [Zostera marina]